MGLPQGFAQRLGDGGFNATPSRNDDGARLFQQLQAIGGLELYAARPAQHAGLCRAGGKAVPVFAHFGPWQTENFNRAAVFEQAQPVVHDDSHQS